MNLAAALGHAGHKAVVVDADPQGSSLRWSQQRRGPAPFPVVAARITSVSSFVATIEAAANGGVDTVVVDLPPSLAKPSLVVSLTADLIVIPITASPLDLWAAKAAIETVMDARNLRNGELPLLTVLPSRIDDRTSRGRKLAGGLKAMGFTVGPTLRERIAFRDAADRGLTITDLEERSPARRDFADLAVHVTQRLRELARPVPTKTTLGEQRQHPPGPDTVPPARRDPTPQVLR